MGGPIMTPAPVMEDDRLTLSEKVVYGKVYALHFFGSRKCCDASNGYIGANTGIASGTVANAISKLVKLNHLARRETEEGRRVLVPLLAEGEPSPQSEGGVHSRVKGGSLTSEAIKKEEKEEVEVDNGGQAEPPELDLTPPPSRNGTGNEERFPPKSRLPRDPSTNHREYPEEFEIAWESFPDRRGSNPKGGAYKAWRARVQDGADPEVLAEKAEHYASFCREEGKDPQYIMQAATFYGPQEPWDQEWLDQPEARKEANRRTAARFERRMQMGT